MKKLRIHYLQHVHFEGLGCIQDWINKNQHTLSATQFYRNDNLPAIDSIDWLIVMGGPMGVDDESEYPWLKEEKIFIRKAIEDGKTVLGICLGAQLIASALGARVYRNSEREIGWFPVQRTCTDRSQPLSAVLQQTFTVFHWHGDTFELPHGAIRLAESPVCKNQAFFYGKNVLGLQFHLEVTQGSIADMVENGMEELKVESDFVQSPTSILNETGYHSMNHQLLENILDELLILKSQD